METAPGSTVCSRCHIAGPVRLLPGQACAACEAQEAWNRQEGDKLVIGKADIAAAVAARRGEAAPRWRSLLVLLPALVAIALGVGAWVCLRAFSRPRPVGPLASLMHGLGAQARGVALLGAAAFLVALVGLWRLRRGRHFRRIALLVPHLVAVLAAGTLVILGGLAWYGSSAGFGLAHMSMPPRPAVLAPAPAIQRIADATVIIVSPDGDGDARGAALGSGAVIAAEPGKFFVVTCSHVAMPYAEVGAWRHAARAYPVWVELADGRSGPGKVRFTAPPPLDVAVVEVAIAGPAPPVVPLATDSDALDTGAAVVFVPNPYRDGWMVHRGLVQKRERHLTPAGAYSLLYTDLPVQPGDSGSGLFDAAGRLVGLNTWTRMGVGAPQGISLPSEAMRAIALAVAKGDIDHLDDALPPAPVHP